MNEDFEKFVKSKTVLDMDRLNKAMISGINRAKNDRLDKIKIFKIMTAAVLVLFITINIEVNEQLQENAWIYFAQTSKVSVENSKALENYINIGTKIIMENLQ